MEQQLKQRLVGVGVIFSLAVIFLPLLLDGSGRRPEDLKINIPPEPYVASNVRVEEKVIELKKELVQISQLEPVFIDEVNSPPSKQNEKTELKPVVSLKSTKSEKIAAKITKPPAKKPVASSKTPKTTALVGGDSWIVQAGSFSDKEKAYKLRNKLRQSKLSSVFIEQYKHQGLTRYRVRMGPFIEKKKATVVQNKVMAKYSINGLLMHYEK